VSQYAFHKDILTHSQCGHSYVEYQLQGYRPLVTRGCKHIGPSAQAALLEGRKFKLMLAVS